MDDDYTTRTIRELYILESNLTWSRYNMMLLANSIILGAIALLLTGSHMFLPFAMVLGGIFTCLLWHRLTTIGFSMCNYRYNKAIKRENGLPDDEKVFKAEGPMSCWGVERCAKAVIWIFLVIYGFVVIWLTIKILFSTNWGRYIIS